MIAIGWLILFWGIVLTVGGVAFYKSRIRKVKGWEETRAQVESSEFVFASAIGSGWRVTLSYSDNDYLRYYYTPKALTAPFPIGFIREPVILYNRENPRQAYLKSSYYIHSRILFIIGLLISLWGAAYVFL